MTYAEKLVFIIFFEGYNPNKHPDFEQAISILNPDSQHIARRAVKAITQAMQAQREACLKDALDKLDNDGMWSDAIMKAILNAEVLP